MATEELRIVIREDGTQAIKRSFDQMGRAADQATRGVYLFKRAFRTLAVAYVARELMNLADSFTNIKNRLGLVTSGTADLNRVTNELLAISNRTRTSFATNAELFNRMTLATRDFGYSQKELLQVTETLNKGIIVSGAGVREANNALIQLSQGLASGRLNGDELRSVLEQLPIVADVIAKQLGTTRGELRKLGREGVITTDVIIQAIKNAEGEIGGRFAKTVPTLAQSFTILYNNLIKVVSAFNDATNAVGSLGSMFHAIAMGVGDVATFIEKNQALVKTLTSSMLALGVAMAGIWTVRHIAAWTNAIGLAVAGTARYYNEVRKGNIVELGSAKAGMMKATYYKDIAAQALGSAVAERQRSQAQVGLIKNELARIQVQKAALQQERQWASTRKEHAVITNQMAQLTAKETMLRNALYSASGQLLTAQARENTALKNNAKAHAALQAAYARTRLGALAAAAAARAFNAAVAFMGGWTGVAFTAIAVALSLWFSRTREARDILQEYKDLVDQTKGSFNSVSEAIRDMTHAQRELTFAKYNETIDETKKQIKEVGNELDSLVFRFAGSAWNRATTAKLDKDLASALKQFRNGKTSLEQLQTALSVGTGSDDAFTRGWAQRILKVVDKLIQLKAQYKEASGSADEFKQFIDNHNRSLDGTEERLRRVSVASKEYAKAMGQINDIVPDFKTEEKTKGDLADLEAQKNIAIQNARKMMSSPLADSGNQPLGLEGAIRSQIAKIEERVQKGKEIVTGYTKVLEDLKKAERAAAQDAMEPREAALDKVRQAYGERDKQLREALKNGADEVKINDLLWRSYQLLVQELDNVNKKYDEKDQKKADQEARKKSFEKELRDLERENQLLEVSADQHAVLTKIYAMENTLQRELTAGEKEQVANLVNHNTARSRQLDLFRDIRGPMQDLEKSQAALNELLRKGAISAAEFNAKMYELRQTVLDYDQAIRDVRAFDPDMKKIDDKKSQLEELGIKVDLAKQKLREVYDAIPDQSAATQLGLAKDLEEIDKVAKKSRDSINGVTDVVKDLEKASKEAKIGAIADPREAALAKVRQEAEERAKAIKEAFNVETNAARQSELLAENERILGQEIANTNRMYDERDAKKADRESRRKTFASELQELKEENELLRINGVYRDQLAKVFEIQRAIKRQLTDEERRQVFQIVEENKALEMERKLYDDITGSVETYAQSKAALHSLLDKGLITLEQYTTKLRELEIQMLQNDRSVEGGYKRGFLKLQQEITDFASQSEQVVTNAFNNMEDALVSFVTTGKVDFKSMVQSMLADLTRLLFRYYLMAPIFKMLTGQDITGGNGGGGGGKGLLGMLGSLFGFGGGGNGGGGGGNAAAASLATLATANKPNFSPPMSLAGIGSPGQLAQQTSQSGVAAQVWNFFASKGLAQHQVAGIMGHVGAESGFNPRAIGDAGKAFGLFQHHAARGGGQDLLASGVQGQLEHAWKELQTTESATLQRLMAATNTREATRAFGGFERPQGFSWANPEGAHRFPERLKGAEEALTKFGGTTTSVAQNVEKLGQGAESALTSIKDSVSKTATDATKSLVNDAHGGGGVAQTATEALNKLADSSNSAVTSLSGFGNSTLQVSNSLIQATGGLSGFTSALKSFLGSSLGGGSSWFQGLLSSFGGLGGALGHMNSISPLATSAILRGAAGLYDEGGYTGNGEKHQVAGVVHKGEYVFTKEATRNLGVKQLEQLHEAAKTKKGFASGGWTGGVSTGYSAGSRGILSPSVYTGALVAPPPPPQRQGFVTDHRGDKKDGGYKESGGPRAPAEPNKVRIINVFDPAVVGEYLATEEGERVVMNVMRRLGK